MGRTEMLDIESPKIGQTFLGWRVRYHGPDKMPGRDCIRLDMDLGADAFTFEVHLPTKRGIDQRPLDVQRRAYFLSGFFCIESNIEHRFPHIYASLIERRRLAAEGGVLSAFELATLAKLASH